MALLQTVKITSQPTSPATAAITIGTAGNTLIVNIVQAVNTGTMGVSDSKTSTWTQIGTTQTNGLGLASAWFYAPVGSSGSDTISVTWNSAASNGSAIIREYAGTLVLDKNTAATGTSASPSSGATAATTTANEIVIGSFADNWGTGQTYTVGSGYGNLDSIISNSSWNIATEDKTVTSTGAQTATVSLLNSTVWIAMVATFSGGGGGATAHNMMLMGVGS